MDHVHPCTVCGALVAGGSDFEASAAPHAAWHGLLERRVAEARDHYTPPPTYGGR